MCYYQYHFYSEKFSGILLTLPAYIDVSVQDCSISSANALKIPQSFPKPSIYSLFQTRYAWVGPVWRSWAYRHHTVGVGTVPARCLHHMLLQPMERHLHIRESKYSEILGDHITSLWFFSHWDSRNSYYTHLVVAAISDFSQWVSKMSYHTQLVVAAISVLGYHWEHALC